MRHAITKPLDRGSGKPGGPTGASGPSPSTTPNAFGDCDFSPLPDVPEMFELLPNTQLAVLPKAPHVGVTLRPGEVLALIIPFLDER